jgi:two-component system, NtrC family, sensor kinase
MSISKSVLSRLQFWGFESESVPKTRSDRISVPNILLRYRRSILAVLTTIAGVGVSAIAALEVYHWEEKMQHAQLQEQLDQIATNIQKDVNSSLEVVRTVGTLYSTSEDVKEEKLQSFVQSFLYRYSSLKAIAWVPRVANEERFLYENLGKTPNHPFFQIQEKTQGGEIIKAESSSKYFPIFHLIPHWGNQDILGLDLASIPAYQIPLQKSVERGELITTSPEFSAQEKQSSFLVIFPVFNNSPQKYTKSDPLEEENLKGFNIGVFLVAPLIRTAVQEAKLNLINVYIEDAMVSDSQNFIAFYHGENQQIIVDPNRAKSLSLGEKADCPDGSGCSRILNIGDRRWLLQFFLTPEYRQTQQHWRGLITLICGLILTSVVLLYVLSLLSYTENIEEVVTEKTVKSQQLEQTLEELKKTQTHLIQTEKMSSLGLLVAGVAHEINNPVNFIYGNLHHANQYLKDLLYLISLYQKHYPQPHPDIPEYMENIDFLFVKEDLPKLISSMRMGAQRILEIVLSLRNFSRLDESDMKLVNIHEGIDSTLLILQNRLKPKFNYPPIEIIKKYGNLPFVECYPGQLNQVFLNILINAIDAIDCDNQQREKKKIPLHSSQITIKTEQSHPDRVMIRISDNGMGITETIKQRLFDPFFTTKPVGKGTGLGLSISYQIIVDQHKGSLRCESSPGKGTEFIIEIPLRLQEFIWEI